MKPLAVQIIHGHEKILIAANWKSEYEQPEFGDPNYIAFIQVMTYRREIARMLLNEVNEATREDIKSILDECNDKIRQILGL